MEQDSCGTPDFFSEQAEVGCKRKIIDMGGDTSHELKASSSSSTKPLKKAKFLWQVKGQLKKEDDAVQGSSNSNETMHCESILDSEIVPACESSATLLEEMSSSSTDDTSDDGSGDSSYQVDRCDRGRMVAYCFTTMLQSLSGDQNLPRWQSKQVARGILDNAINRVMEETRSPWLLDNMPEPQEGRISVRLPRLSIPPVETAAVSAAIGKVGLVCADEVTDVNKNECKQSSPPFHEQPVTGLQNKWEHILVDNSSPSDQDEVRMVDENCNDSVVPADSENNILVTSIEEKEGNLASQTAAEDVQHELLDVAVSFAIHEKGLSLS